jgi:hypothetical protein
LLFLRKSSHSVFAVPHIGAVAQVALDTFSQLIQLFYYLVRKSEIEGGQVQGNLVGVASAD